MVPPVSRSAPAVCHDRLKDGTSTAGGRVHVKFGRRGRTAVWDKMSKTDREDTSSPGYLGLFRSGALAERARALRDILSECVLCPRGCRVNRNAGRQGACGIDGGIRVAAVSIHPWEEPPISGTRGSGTVFFSGCTLKCIFCQNYPISQLGVGHAMTASELASAMVGLQSRGAHNINLVTPTHQAAGFVEALVLAVPMGLRIPIVYNTSGYESLETLKLLEGVVDIYLPDIKYSNPDFAGAYSGRADYVQYNRSALLEMWRQAGPLQVDENGIARRGVIVRHLVLPGDLAGTTESLKFLAGHMGPGVWLSLMNQYFPAHKALHTPPLDRKVSGEEYEAAFKTACDLGLLNGFAQMCPTDDEDEADGTGPA